MNGADGNLQRNIFGNPLGICYTGAPGLRDSCPFGGDLHHSLLCVAPVGVHATPFCLDMEHFGRYLMVHPPELGP